MINQIVLWAYFNVCLQDRHDNWEQKLVLDKLGKIIYICVLLGLYVHALLNM